MITPSFGLTATERVLPRLALDFTTASLDSRVTFTRSGSTATTTNSSGVIVGVNADLPRFNFNPTTLACQGLLIEEQRTNNTLGSAAFNDAAYWSPIAASIGATPITSPDNTSTGFKLVESATTAIHFIVPTTLWATTIGQLITRSVYVKAGERFRFEIQADSTSYGSAQRAQFNLQTVTASISLGTGTASITNAGNGWYRCVFNAPAATAIAVGTGQFRLLNDAGVPSYAGDGTSGLYLWGAQREDGAFVTSYIPTVASTVTRNADVATMTGANFSDWYNASEGAAVIQALPSTISNTRPAIQLDDNTANESIALRGVAADPQLFVVDGGSTQATLDAGTITANTVYKLGGAWKASSFATAINGAAAVTSASGTLPTVTQARLGSDGTNYFNGHLQNLRYWPQRLTNAEVQAFSK